MATLENQSFLPRAPAKLLSCAIAQATTKSSLLLLPTRCRLRETWKRHEKPANYGRKLTHVNSPLTGFSPASSTPHSQTMKRSSRKPKRLSRSLGDLPLAISISLSAIKTLATCRKLRTPCSAPPSSNWKTQRSRFRATISLSLRVTKRLWTGKWLGPRAKRGLSQTSTTTKLLYWDISVICSRLGECRSGRRSWLSGRPGRKVALSTKSVRHSEKPFSGTCLQRGETR